MSKVSREIQAACNMCREFEGEDEVASALLGLEKLVKDYTKAKGRYHTQIAMARLREAVGLKAHYPEKYKGD